MCPLAPSTSPPGFMSSYGTNDEIILSLDQINRGSPIPDDVIVDNPYQYDPSNLPAEGLSEPASLPPWGSGKVCIHSIFPRPHLWDFMDGAWFLIRKTEEKETKYGLWIAKGSACEIFANSAISGWRTTFEFFQVQAAIEQQTVWIMQEYKVTPKGQHDQTKSQESALCRFLSLWNDPEQNDDRNILDFLSLMASVNPDTSGNDGQRSIGEPQVNSQTEGAGSSLVDKSRDQFVDDKVAEIDCILRGDYLELNDLADAASHSSSSENSSRQSFESDEYFDILALLADLDDEKKEDLSGKGSTSNYNIMMSEIANDVVVQPAPLGFIFKGSDATAKETQQAPDNDKSKSPDQAAKKLKAERTDEGPSHACRATTSSSSSSDEPGRAARREEKRTKKLMKYLCFMPF